MSEEKTLGEKSAGGVQEDEEGGRGYQQKVTASEDRTG